MNTTLACLMRILDEMIPEEHTVKDDTLFLPEWNTSVTPSIILVDAKRKNSVAAHMLYTVRCPLLGEDFVEVASGIGTDEAEALQRSAASFLQGAWCALRKLLCADYSHTLVSDFFGTEKHWDVAESCGAVLKGKDVPNDGSGTRPIWDVIREKLPLYLGDRSIQWVKAFIARQADGSVTAELRINGIVVHDLSDLLAEYAEGIDNKGHFYTCKEYFFLRQKDKSDEAYPYTAEQVYAAVDTAMDVFTKYLGYDETKQFQVLSAQLGDPILADELCAWIPELCAEMNWDDIRYSDFFSVSIGEKTEPVLAARTQFTAYPWVVPYLSAGISDGRYKQELYRSLILYSATGSAILNAMQDGNKSLAGAVFSPLNLSMEKDYVIR